MPLIACVLGVKQIEFVSGIGGRDCCGVDSGGGGGGGSGDVGEGEEPDVEEFVLRGNLYRLVFISIGILTNLALLGLISM
jgi:hypothetical protein